MDVLWFCVVPLVGMWPGREECGRGAMKSSPLDFFFFVFPRYIRVL